MKSATKRFSLGVKIASILTCIVVAAVGFASWLIVKPIQPETKTGSFTVHEAEIVDVALDVSAINSSSSIVFGKGTTANANPWLRATADIANESLTATFNVSVNTQNDNVNLDTVAEKFDVTFSVADAIATKFNSAIGGYIAAPIVIIKAGGSEVDRATYNNADVTVSIDAEAAKTQEFTVEIVFDWGTITGGENPYKYFNALEPIDENITKANDFLNTIYEITGAISTPDAFDLTIAAVAKS